MLDLPRYSPAGCVTAPYADRSPACSGVIPVYNEAERPLAAMVVTISFGSITFAEID